MKELYVILDSRVNKIQVGHVVLEHPVITFIEGSIPRNTYHNTLAFRFSIGLNRVDSEYYADKKKEKEKAELEAYNKLTDEQKEAKDEAKR